MERQSQELPRQESDQYSEQDWTKDKLKPSGTNAPAWLAFVGAPQLPMVVSTRGAKHTIVAFLAVFQWKIRIACLASSHVGTSQNDLRIFMNASVTRCWIQLILEALSIRRTFKAYSHLAAWQDSREFII